MLAMNQLKVKALILMMLASPLFLLSQNIDDLKVLAMLAPDKHTQFENCLAVSSSYMEKHLPDSSLVYSEKALQVASKMSSQEWVHDEGVSAALTEIGKAYYEKLEYKLADSFFIEALKLTSNDSIEAYLHYSRFKAVRNYEKLDICFDILEEMSKNLGSDTTSQLWSMYHNGLGITYMAQFAFVDALGHLLKAKEYTLNKEELRIINHNINSVYSQMGDYEKALKINLELYEDSKSSNDARSQLYNLFSIANTYLDLKKPKSVKKTFWQAQKLKEESGFSKAIGYMYFCMGEALIMEEQMDSAVYYYNLGLQISEEQNEKKEWADNHYGLCHTYYLLGDFEKSKYHGELSKAGYPSDQRHEMLADIYASENNYERAYEEIMVNWNAEKERKKSNSYYKLLSQLMTDQFNQERLQEQKQHEYQLKLERGRYTVGVLSVFLGGVFLFLYRQAKQKAKLEKFNERLKTKNQTLQHFAYVASHDLKEPLRVMTGFSQLLKKEILKRGEDAQRELDYLSYIENNGKTLYEITNSLQTYTDVSFKNFQKDSFKVNEVFDAVRSNLSSIIEDKGGHLVFNNKMEDVEFNFSKPQLILLLQNLVQNGFKYNNSDSPKVEVNIEKSDGRFLFEVCDNGIGIAPEFQAQIFQPFKTLDNKSVHNSSGLGLAICKLIVERNGGDIWVGKSNDDGTTFKFAI